MTPSDEKWRVVRETVGKGSLSVVMPLYRLAAKAEANLRQVADLFERHGVRSELVPVDDGSDDGTDLILSRFAEAAPPGWASAYEHVVIRPVICRLNGGKGAALRAGFEASAGEYVMLLDGDLDITPRQTPAFFSALVSNGADIVVGSKRHPRSVVQYPWHRRLVSFCYFALVRLFVGLRITDTQTGMKLFRREVLGQALDRMLVKAYAFDLELLAIAASRGAKIVEAPVVIRFGQKFGALRPSTVHSMALDTLAVFYRLRLLRYYARCLVPRRLDHDPLVTVVVACPGRSWMLDECVRAIGAQTYREWEAIVLPDAPFEADPAWDGRVRILPTGKVRPAEKRNLGIREAKGEVVAFIDDDAYPDANWLEYAVKYFGDSDIGAVGGPGVTPPGDGYMAQLGGRVYVNPLVSGNYRYRYRAGGVRRDVDDYPSCNLFVRTGVLRRIGGYRTDFWPGEDTLLCKDIVDGGSRIVYDPWVVVNHHRRPLFAPHLRQLGRYAFHRGYFVRRFPSNSARLSYFVPSALLLAHFAAAAAALSPLPAALKIAAASPLALYAAAVALTTFSVSPATWLLTAAGVYATHLAYGARFLQGLCARRAPCEYIGKDHPNEAKKGERR
ncbi:MAG: glycosyltransferase [Kiritimatiellae bacterium]|nr:glycosyltransferase [Kiritimatiellia bacterium]